VTAGILVLRTVHGRMTATNRVETWNEAKSNYADGSSGRDVDTAEDFEVVVGENVLPDLMNFISSSNFRATVTDFASRYASLFHGNLRSNHESKSDDVVLELTHEHMEVFEKYQDLLETLFDRFAKRHETTVRAIYQCCQETGRLVAVWALCTATCARNRFVPFSDVLDTELFYHSHSC
jgi:hypothetical protein